MKTQKWLALIFTLLSFNTFANDIDNGGDSCEKRIQAIRNDIQDWIRGGGPDSLKLPESISLEDYKSRMLDQIDHAIISCPSKPVKVGKASKTCRNYKVNSTQILIECQWDRFMRTPEEEQYTLVHHEYAGAAGFEVNAGKEESDYVISRQLSGFLVDTVVKKLALVSKVTKGVTMGQDPVYSKFKRLFDEARPLKSADIDLHAMYGGVCAFRYQSEETYKKLARNHFMKFKQDFVEFELGKKKKALDLYINVMRPNIGWTCTQRYGCNWDDMEGPSTPIVVHVNGEDEWVSDRGYKMGDRNLRIFKSASQEKINSWAGDLDSSVDNSYLPTKRNKTGDVYFSPEVRNYKIQKGEFWSEDFLHGAGNILIRKNEKTNNFVLYVPFTDSPDTAVCNFTIKRKVTE